MELQAAKIAEITGGNSNYDFTVKGISLDTRTLKKGDLYIALKGNYLNGHTFLREAITLGAAGVLVNEEELNNCYKPVEYSKWPLIKVKNPEHALKQLAKYARLNFKGIIVGITGSVGKTTLKDMLTTAISNSHKVYSTRGNFNNEIGLPVCLAHLTNDYEFGVFELGMSAQGEIERLSELLQPNVVVISEVSNAHSQFFNSTKEIAAAKLEILKGLTAYENKSHALNGLKTAVFNKNNQFFEFAKETAVKQGVADIYSFAVADSTLPVADFNLLSTVLQNIKGNFNRKTTVNINNQNYTFNLPVLAPHNSLLATVALGICTIIGVDVSSAILGLEHYEVKAGRGKISTLTVNNCTFTLIDDSYNASPLSMQKSILTLKELPGSVNKTLILGEMLELSVGEEKKAHTELEKYIKEISPTKIFLLGKRMQNLYNVLSPKDYNFCGCFTDYKELKIALLQNLQQNDVVLAKGSFSSNVHLLVKDLLKTVNL